MNRQEAKVKIYQLRKYAKALFNDTHGCYPYHNPKSRLLGRMQYLAADLLEEKLQKGEFDDPDG